jgi:hypothetical protein
MTTFILPTKTQIQGYTASPAQLLRDATVETFLSVTNQYDFLLQLNQQWRAGATSFTYYNQSPSQMTLLNTYLTDTSYGYNYTCGSITQETTPGAHYNWYKMTVSWA